MSVTPSPTATTSPGTLGAERRRQRAAIQAAAHIAVDEVQADGVMPDLGLARTGRADFHVDIVQDFRAAVLLEPDRFGHGGLLGNG
jgi:hypothetical protein